MNSHSNTGYSFFFFYYFTSKSALNSKKKKDKLFDASVLPTNNVISIMW